MDFTAWGATVADDVRQNEPMRSYATAHGNINIEAMPQAEARLALLSMLLAERSDGTHCWQSDDPCYCARALAILLDVGAAEMDPALFRRVIGFLAVHPDAKVAKYGQAIEALFESGEAGSAKPVEEYCD